MEFPKTLCAVGALPRMKIGSMAVFIFSQGVSVEFTHWQDIAI